MSTLSPPPLPEPPITMSKLTSIASWIAITSTARQTDATIKSRTRQTALYRTLKLCWEKRHFAPNSPFNPVSPQDSLFPEDVEDVKSRFEGAEDEEFIISIAQDLMDENSKLKRMMAKTGLEKWWEALVDETRREVEEEEMKEQDETLMVEGEEEEDTMMTIKEGDTVMEGSEEGSEEGSYVEEDTFAGHNGGRDWDGDETME